MNKNGNGNGGASVSSKKRTRGQNLTSDNIIEGGNTSNKIKRGESSKTCVETDPGQSGEFNVKKMSMKDLSLENADGEHSSSSTYWMRSRNEALYTEIKELELTRKRKKDTDDSSNSPDQDEVADEGPINNLPPEMLTKILKVVDPFTLFDCRLVNRQWCDIASETLTTKTNIMLSFKKEETTLMRMDSGQRERGEYNITRLQEFVETMKQSKHCPYASFSFDVNPSFFGEDDWIEFLSLFAPPTQRRKQNQSHKIKRLFLEYDSSDEIEGLLLFVENLRDLVLFKIPRLEELGLEFASDIEDSKSIKWFPRSKTPEPESATKTAALSASVSTPVQLPYLKVLVIHRCMFEDFPGIVEDLLIAAVKLNTISKGSRLWIEEDVQFFQFLHSLGKLHLLKKTDLELTTTFLSSLKNTTTNSLAFNLHEIKFYPFKKYISPDVFADAIYFISNLLKSSKDTLEKLIIPALGFLNGLQFPEFTKLKTLKLEPCDKRTSNGVERQYQLFPRGIRSRSKEIFSTVVDLSSNITNWQRAFPQEDSIPIFSNVHTFCFSDKELVGNWSKIAKLGLMCPNLKHCKITTYEGNPWDFYNIIRENPEQFNFPRVGRQIWTHLKQLESLEVDIDFNLLNHSFPFLDSCFTGISSKNCQRLSELMEAGKILSKSETQLELPESEELMTLSKREHPSILDMKGLKKLTINPHSGESPLEGKDLFSKKITWISEQFAFKLMPQLEFNGRRPSTTS